MEKKKFYTQTWFLWVMLIFIAPIGIFLLWKYKRFNQPVRIILTAIFTIFFIIGITPNNSDNTETTSTQDPGTKQAISTQEPVKQTEKLKEAEQPKPTEQPKQNELTEKIKVEVDFQDLLKDGKRKVVFYVTNNSDKLYDGTVTVNLLDSTGKRIDGDTIFVEKLVPQGKTWTIVWANTKSIKSSYEISGKLSEFKGEATTAQFEIANTKSGLNYQTFCVVVPKIEKDALVEVVKNFRSKYTKDTVTGFQIYFYTKDQENEAKAGKFGNEKANYYTNYNNGNSELSIYDTNETVNVK